MSSRFEAVVFDLDDTLYPERQFARSGLRVVGDFLAERHGAAGVTETLLALLERGERGDIIDQALARHSISPDLTPQLVELYRGHRPRIELFPGAEQLLRRLREGTRLGLLTDGPLISQRQKIEVLGLGKLFDSIVINDEHGRDKWKPDPWGYRRVMEDLGAAGQRCCYVGDNPIKDFIAARALGWGTFRLAHWTRLDPTPPPTPDHEADLVVPSLAELEEELLGGSRLES